MSNSWNRKKKNNLILWILVENNDLEYNSYKSFYKTYYMWLIPIFAASTFSGIETFVNDEHSENAFNPIEVTFDGIFNCVSVEQP